jgi:glycosyltransferase involved in cell wall biosynthesis
MTSNIPRVSIGLPVYNGERYLATAIDSLLSQTYTDFELIISDNASTDSTSEICQAYAARDSRIRYYYESKNRGISWNFRRTFDLARGEFFKWHAHDDTCAPTLVERSVEALDREPKAVLCYPRVAIIDDFGELAPDDPASWRPPLNSSDASISVVDQSTVPANDHDRRGLDSSSVAQRFYGILLDTVWCLESYGMVRTAVMRTTGKLRTYRASEKVFLAEMALRGQYAEIPEILFFVRRHEQQFTMLATGTAQQKAVKPRWSRLRLPVPRHVRSTLGYLLLLPNAPISLFDRLRCFGVLVRYILQVSKWKRIIINACRDVGIHDGYLQLPQSKCSADISSGLPQTTALRSSAPANSV